MHISKQPCRGAMTALVTAFPIAAMLWSPAALAAVNSYRFMHVTINTPWHIFLFLMVGVFAPFILMIVLMWRYSFGKKKPQTQKPQTPDPGTRQPTDK